MTKKIYLLGLYPKKHFIYYCIFIVIISIFILLSCFIKVYDSYYVTGLINCDKECVITISFPYDKVDILKQNPHIEYLNKEYNINSITYNDPYLNNEIPYEDINITTDLTSKDQIINLKILYNKQRVIKKIKNIIKGE